ncbi:MAG: enoyl-[acyl-carrier-protein] reductase FabL [Clostridia bacterium]|nr:enoyl-[acyl-carrier-protein] reductase FabL [Clostridia bacterium]
MGEGRFAGKVALVTGGSRGIGRAITLRLASEGADVVINFFRNRGPAEETARQVEAMGRRARLVKAHVGEPEKVRAMFEEVEAAFGRLDILVNNAASGSLHPVMELDAKGWDWTMNINARGAFLCSQAAVPLMRKAGGGRIVNITSLGSHRVLPFYVAVGVSKAALEALTRYLAVDLAAYGIAVNAVSGSVVDTDAIRHFPNREELLESAQRETPAGRILRPEDIAAAVAWLCSDEAEMVRGQVLVVDGGYSLR